jgi:hypothetical protein
MLSCFLMKCYRKINFSDWNRSEVIVEIPEYMYCPQFICDLMNAGTGQYHIHEKTRFSFMLMYNVNFDEIKRKMYAIYQQWAEVMGTH